MFTWVKGKGKQGAASSLVAVRIRSFEQPVNRVAGESAALEKAHLLSPFGGICGHCWKFFLPNGARRVEFVFARIHRELRDAFCVYAFRF